MISFIVATPLQLFNCLLIMHHCYPNDKTDIFALDIACDMHTVIDPLRNESQINEVFYLNDVCKRKSRVGTIYDHLITTRRQKSFLRKIKNNDYSDLFSTWVGSPATWIFTKLKKNNPSIHLHYYEEGTGVYHRNICLDYHGIKKLYKLLGYYCEADYIEDIFFHEPSLIQVRNDEKIKIKRIGHANKNDLKNFEFLRNRIIPYSSKVLFFENNFYSFPQTGVNEEKLLEYCTKVVARSQLMVRLHPRTREHNYIKMGFDIDKNTTVSWEHIIGLSNVANDLILISSLSTAVFSPKLIYGYEPRVILLGDLIDNNRELFTCTTQYWSDDFRNFVYKFKTLYSNQDNVAIPRSLSELFGVLKKWIG